VSEDVPSVCFVEGFRFKTRLESLQNNISVFRQLQGAPLTPQQVEVKKEMEKTIRTQITSLPESIKCASPELENTIRWHATMTAYQFDEALKEPRNWRKVDEYLTYLETTMEGW
jgi:hypothetical protein